MTAWQSGGLVLGYFAYAVAWVRGGPPERLGAGVLLLACLVANHANGWEVGDLYPGFIIMDSAIFLVFGWLNFRSDRWWTAVAAGAAGLIVLGHVIRLLDRSFAHGAMVSAKIGLAYVVDLALLAGVGERWLAGEQPAGRAAWAAANRMTAARRGAPAP
ncbi:hypothetical protein [Brevundimonas sp.]|uniref:hypothetical protein n=1 Tax=Brevundimonas sp. TaxID=1871086 RepID=UPI002D24D186|nr:hypothetical protein [Brevundimonas sp.]HYD28289.1 hypothetical protein [Brevundimonas sp.]